MKKEFVIILFALFLVMFIPNVKADWEWDNCGQYNEETNTMCVYNTFCYGDLLGCATLESPHNVNVIAGEETKVGWFNLENYFEMDGADVWGAVELSKEENGEFIPIERGYKYKEQHFEDPREYCWYDCPGYGHEDECQEVCTERADEEWRAFNVNNPVEVGNSTVGLFTEVEPREFGEWIPTLYGVPVPQWATWNETFSDHLISYFEFNETAGEAVDSVGKANGTIGGTIARGTTLQLNHAYTWTGGDANVSLNSSNDWYGGANNDSTNMSFALYNWLVEFQR